MNIQQVVDKISNVEIVDYLLEKKMFSLSAR
jgi:hypothetical protein